MSFATINPIATLIAPAEQSQAQAAQAPAGSPVSVAAASLLATFGEAEQTQNKVATLYFMAIGGLTCEEFDAACTEALATAKAADKLAGWIVGDKKGRDAYGPRQSSLASAQTGMRQVFGVARLNPETIVKQGPSGIVSLDLFPNMSRAVQAAAVWLASTNEDGTKQPMNWRGVLLSAEKVAAKRKATQRANNAAFEAAAAANPRQAGEDDAQYEKRIEGLMGQYAEKLADAAVADAAKKLWKKLTDKHGDAAAVAIVGELMILAELG